MLNDFRFGFRMLLKNPAFTAVAVLSSGAWYRGEYCNLSAAQCCAVEDSLPAGLSQA